MLSLLVVQNSRPSNMIPTCFPVHLVAINIDNSSSRYPLDSINATYLIIVICFSSETNLSQYKYSVILYDTQVQIEWFCKNYRLCRCRNWHTCFFIYYSVIFLSLVCNMLNILFCNTYPRIFLLNFQKMGFISECSHYQFPKQRLTMWCKMGECMKS